MLVLKQPQPSPVYLNNEPIPKSDIAVKHLDLDKRPTWAKHVIHSIKLKLTSRLCLLRPILSKYTKMSLKTKIHIYNVLLEPVWTYGIPLWDSAKKSNTQKIQMFRNKILRTMTNASPYISNHTTRTDLHIPEITETAKILYWKFRNRLQDHSDRRVRNLLANSIPGNPPKRLRRQWPRDLI